eukprot:13536099-Alexandrium_andersonii.AAC.1
MQRFDKDPKTEEDQMWLRVWRTQRREARLACERDGMAERERYLRCRVWGTKRAIIKAKQREMAAAA